MIAGWMSPFTEMTGFWSPKCENMRSPREFSSRSSAGTLDAASLESLEGFEVDGFANVSPLFAVTFFIPDADTGVDGAFADVELDPCGPDCLPSLAARCNSLRSAFVGFWGFCNCDPDGSPLAGGGFVGAGMLQRLPKDSVRST